MAPLSISRARSVPTRLRRRVICEPTGCTISLCWFRVWRRAIGAGCWSSERASFRRRRSPSTLTAGRPTLAAFPPSIRSGPTDRRVKRSSQSPSILGRSDGGRALTVSLDSPNSGALLRQLGVHTPTSGGGRARICAQCERRVGEGLRRRCDLAACRCGAGVARPLPACGRERRREAVWVRQGQVAEPRPACRRPWPCAGQWRRARACRYRIRRDLARRSMDILAARGDDCRGQGERRSHFSACQSRLRP